MGTDHGYDGLDIAEEVLLGKLDGFVGEMQPLAIILGGQPASGKGKLFEQIQSHYFGKKFVIINGDEFRAFHPRSEKIASIDGRDYADITQTFANTLVQFMKQECIKKRYNFILESTFRNLKTIRITSQELKEQNYQIAVHALSVPYWDSLLGIFERYEGQIKDTGLGRFSPLSTHNEAFKALPENLKVCLEENLFDEIIIYKRTLTSLNGVKVKSVAEIKSQMKHRLPISNPDFYRNKFQNILEMAHARGCVDSNYLNQIDSIIQELNNLE